jgi:MoxR-like ATPase
MSVKTTNTALSQLRDNLTAALRGKAHVVDLAVACLLSEGHLLIEDVPGVGKTTLARALATSTSASCKRIQFTPDLLPSDVTGVNIWHQGLQDFQFKPGGVFANFVIADEINRASPKTQAALLEVMEERQVTIDSESRRLDPPFMVLATQNSIEMEGTYPLPEAQLDRFLMRISIGYPDLDTEIEILENQVHGATSGALHPVLTPASLQRLIEAVNKVHVSSALFDYTARMVASTREAPGIRLGASPRASLGLVRAGRAWALLQGRDYVLPDDIKALAVPVLAHRLLLSSEAELQKRTQAQLVTDVVRSTSVPQESAA